MSRRSDIKKVQQVVINVVKTTEGILDDPAPAVQFVEMGDSSLNFKAHYWVAHWSESHGKKLELTTKIYDALNKEGIGIPFPTRTIYMKKE